MLSTVAAVALALALGASDDAPAYEIDVGDVSGAPDACPSQDLVAEALAARMPGVVARPGREPGPNVLRLGLVISGEGVARVTMTDSAGALRLERDLDLPKSNGAGAVHPHPAPHDRGGACSALADTIALIVERYMRHIGYHEPPPPEIVEARPPPPPAPVTPPPPSGPAWRLGVGLSARPPISAPWRLEPELLLALALGPVELTASAGVALPHDEVVRGAPGAPAAGSFWWTDLPLRFAAGWAVPLGQRVVLAPTLGAGADVVLAKTTGLGQSRRTSAVEPVVEGGVSALLQLTRRIWIDLRAFQGVDLRPEEFFVTTGGTPPTVTLFMTPRTYTRVGVDFGVSLGKIRALP